MDSRCFAAQSVSASTASRLPPKFCLCRRGGGSRPQLAGFSGRASHAGWKHKSVSRRNWAADEESRHSRSPHADRRAVGSQTSRQTICRALENSRAYGQAYALRAGYRSRANRAAAAESGGRTLATEGAKEGPSSRTGHRTAGDGVFAISERRTRSADPNPINQLLIVQSAEIILMDSLAPEKAGLVDVWTKKTLKSLLTPGGWVLLGMAIVLHTGVVSVPSPVVHFLY